jgi:hypothetical protein
MNVPELKSLLARNKAPIAFAASLTPKNIPLTTAEKPSCTNFSLYILYSIQIHLYFFTRNYSMLQFKAGHFEAILYFKLERIIIKLGGIIIKIT